MRINPITAKTSYILNVTRICAAQMVLLGHHLALYGNRWRLPGQWPYIESFGVILFFPLSGFLIAHSIQKARSYGDFVLHRFARIYSGYLPCFLIIICIDTVLWRLGIFPQPYAKNYNAFLVIPNLLLLNAGPVFANIPISPFGFMQFGSARVVWTLALEWWIYIAFGLWVFYWRTLAKRPRLFPLFIFISLVPLVNLFGPYAGGLVLVWLLGAAYYRYLSHEGGNMPCLFYGVLLMVLMVGFCMVAAAMWYIAMKFNDMPGVLDPYNLKFMLILTAFLCFSIGMVLKYPDVIPGWLYYPKTAEFLARYSFTLYLLHYSVSLLLDILPWPPLKLIIFAVVFNNLFALLVASCTEFHYRKLYRFLRSYIEKHPALNKILKIN